MHPNNRKPTALANNATLALKQTLAEQMQISERDIAVRKSMLGFTIEHEKSLSRVKDYASKQVNLIVEEFYQTQLDYSEIALLIGDLHTLTRLKSSMRRYILDLFGGYYDLEYVDKRLRIGKVHHRIGVSPNLYVSAMSQLQNAVETNILPHVQMNEAAKEYKLFKSALRQLFMFDMQLVFDTYISTLVTEVEMARNQMKEYADGLEEVIAERTAQLEELSSKDALTGIFNQRIFFEQLRREIAVAERNRTPVSLIYFDLNDFKKVNDKKGHKEGDRILEIVGAALKESVRKIDIACRYGGDEFCVILPNTLEVLAKDVVARRFLDVLKFQFGCEMTVSMGVVQTGPDVFCESDELVKIADGLMYRAKLHSKVEAGNYIELPETCHGIGNADIALKKMIAQRQSSDDSTFSGEQKTIEINFKANKANSSNGL